MGQNKDYDGTDGSNPFATQHDPHNRRWHGAAFYVVTKDPVEDEETERRVFAAIVKALREEGIVGAAISQRPGGIAYAEEDAVVLTVR